MLPRINTILDKIDQVNELRKQLNKPLYRLNPPLSEQEVVQFENKHGITLPEAYREFLLHAGDGNHEFYYRNITPLKDTDRFNPLDEKPLRLNEPFPFTGKTGKYIIEEIMYRYYPVAMVREILCDEVHGCLLLNYEGYGTSHIALVVTGEQRGNIWHVEDMVHPFYEVSGNTLVTSFSFLDWLEHTLDQELAPHPWELIKTGKHDKVRHLSLTGESEEWRKSFDLNDVFKCTNLEALDLSRSYSITELPEAIGKLEKLIQLKFSGGSLHKLPDVLGTMKHLEILELAYQKLESLPENIGNLNQLKKLSLHWNKDLTALPPSIAYLKNLRYISVSDCDSLDLSQALPYLAKLPLIKELQLTTRHVPDKI